MRRSLNDEDSPQRGLDTTNDKEAHIIPHISAAQFIENTIIIIIITGHLKQCQHKREIK